MAAEAQFKRAADRPTRAAALSPVRAPGPVKREPWSEGIRTPRKKKPKQLAVVTESCTGCSGSPLCIAYCPVEKCLYWVPDPEYPPFGRVEVDPQLCIGCRKCVSKGPDGALLDGCPWDAIEMAPIAEVEELLGTTFEY